MKKFILLFTISLFFSNCENLRVEEDALPTINIDGPYNITQNTVELRGVIGSSELDIISYGFCWSQDSIPTIDDSNIDLTNQSFRHTIEDLLPITTYFFRSYANTVQGLVYSEDLKITTEDIERPPCNINENIFDFGGVDLVFNAFDANPNGSLSTYNIRATGTDLFINIIFKEEPSSFKYLTASSNTSNSQLENTECIIKGIYLNADFSAQSNEEVFIEKIAEGKYKVGFCDITLYVLGGIVPSSANIVTD